MYQGDFHNWVDSTGKMIPIYDPTSQTVGASGAVTRQPFANNLVPQTKLDAIAVNAVKTYQESGLLKPNNGAAPGRVGYAQNNYYIANGSNIAPQNKWSVKGDQSIGIHEQTRLDLRADAFNVFNRQRFGTGLLSLQSNTFVQLTSSGDLLNTPRSMQLALKCTSDETGARGIQ